MPKISIIVPVYNVEEYLARCVDSILAQVYPDFELILVDDGSLDRCSQICDDYANKDDRVCVIHQKNAKQSSARNAGIDIAKGEWLSFIDSDDWVHKDYLKTLVSGVEENVDIILCGCHITENDEEKDVDYSDVTFHNVSLADIQANHMACTRIWGRIIRKESIGNLRFISGMEPVEDTWFNESLFCQEMKFRITDAKLYYYYMRLGSAIHTNFGKELISSISQQLEQISRIDNCEKRKRMINRCYKYVLAARYNEMYTENYSDVKKECKFFFKQLSLFLPELALKDRLIYRTFSIFPALYRAWRIYDDPTLLQFEKQKKMNTRGNS